MGFITRCPACGTAFKVVPDQLKISDGWVRCGHCADVFDATLYLDMLEPAARPEPPPPPPAAVPPPARDDDNDWLVPPPPETAPPVLPGPAATLASVPHGIDLLLEHEEDAGEPMASGRFTESLGADSGFRGAGDFQAELAAFAAAARPVPETDMVDTDGGRPAAEPAVVPRKATPVSAPIPLTAPAREAKGAVPEVPGFVRQARKQAFWRLPMVRAGLLVVGALLAVALLVQVAIHERDRWAAASPGLRPWLEALCQPWRCTVRPVQHLEAVVIESSTLMRRVGDVYGFELVLKNNAPAAVAMPALELSLTDLRDQVLARRVFLPAELPGRPDILAPGARLPVTLSLKLAQEPTTAMTGYRALVFYP